MKDVSNCQSAMNQITCISSETLEDKVINNSINESGKRDSEFSDTLCLNEISSINYVPAFVEVSDEQKKSDSKFPATRSDASDLLSGISIEEKHDSGMKKLHDSTMETLHDSTMETLHDSTIQGFYDFTVDHKRPESRIEDIQMPEVSSTETVKNNTDCSLLIDTTLVMDDNWPDKSLDTIPAKIISPNKPRIIANEVCQTKILLYREPITEDSNFSEPENLNQSQLTDGLKNCFFDTFETESLLDAVDFLGFPKEDAELSFEKLCQNEKKDSLVYNFPPLYRETPTISIPETQSISYLRSNLPDQVEPLGTIIYRQNLIKPSVFNSKGSGYIELNSILQKCCISRKKRVRKNQSILQKGKLRLLTKKKIKQFVKKKESDVQRIKTRSLLKTLNEPLQLVQLEETPKAYQRKPRARKLIISKWNKCHVKDVRILLNRMEISFYQKNSEKIPIHSSLIPDTDENSCETNDNNNNNNDYKEYAHLEYLDSSPIVNFSDSSENKQSLCMDESPKKKIKFPTRRSPRLKKHEIKGIILKSKMLNKVNKRVSFSPNVLQYEY